MRATGRSCSLQHLPLSLACHLDRDGVAGNRYPRVLIGPRLASRQEPVSEQAFEKPLGGNFGILVGWGVKRYVKCKQKRVGVVTTFSSRGIRQPRFRTFVSPRKRRANRALEGRRFVGHLVGIDAFATSPLLYVSSRAVTKERSLQLLHIHYHGRHWHNSYSDETKRK